MLKPPKGNVLWTDSKGRARSSFRHRYADEKAQDTDGLDMWECAGYFGAYRCDTYEGALAQGRILLALRGFNPALAESLIIPF